MQLNPLLHAERVTGRRQSALIDLWSTTGFAAAVSEVTGPHLYEFGELPVPTVAITLYDVRRHVLIENGKVRRDAPVRSGRFRIGQPRRRVVVDAVPDTQWGKLLLLYLGEPLLKEVGTSIGSADAITLRDTAWDIEDPLLEVSAKRLVEASEGGDRPNALLAEQLAYTLALHLTDRYSGSRAAVAEQSAPLDAPVRDRIAEFVRADPGAPITLAAMAAVAGMSPSNFIRSFKRSTGMTPHRFVVEQRVAAARRLLETSDLPIVEIALGVGFSSQSHFGVAFRQVTGESPARYRRLQRGHE
ncbi:AraC family transcriptional regulator [Rhodopseudomonas sp. AAP120]|uniref:helix-turn-helix domain-containing protein n=1 Tax=Rhodopseudomonas sp. AAP120 TaxID=1523430 RepID=UPI0006B93C06|nr:AraC family transcriptional regulator [Rhodopseudomonas sp. AAP120]KPG01437.1 AraC family transcriptional regulator [Rhodopseudomonas sp. AAP120]